MRALEGGNNVKVYNLSAGKSLPDWLTERKRRKLSKRDVDIQHRIELIQDFDMPDVSDCVKVSPDGQYILASGTYKPRLKCFEVSALSQKFERCFDAEVVSFEVLSEDYSKLVLLQDDRYLEFHNQGGRWHRTRIPKFGRDMAYHYPSCDLYVAASGCDVYRLNLNQGRFLESIQADSYGVNKCVFNPVHYLLALGTEDGRVESWDPRSKKRVGILDCAMHMALVDIPLPSYKIHKHLGITSLAYNDGLTLGVGTQTGQILVYDIRSDKPLVIKDHMDGFPIDDLEFHPSSGMVLSMSCNAVKIWEKDSGKPHTSIESDVKFNDLCVIPDSGMIFLATESPKMQIYFLPSLGPAPKWCGHLDALIEELEEEQVTQTYDDYKFVTEEELKVLGLDDLIGSNVLRAVMHGYYIDVRLYNKAKMIANPFDYEAFIKKKVKQKIAEQNERKSIKKALPKVNQEIFARFVEDKVSGSDKQIAAAKSILKDNRFKAMFSENEFTIDKEEDAFKLLQPVLHRNAKQRLKQTTEDMIEEEEFIKAQKVLKKGLVESDPSSDSDSIISEDEASVHSEPEENVSSTKTVENSSIKSPLSSERRKKKKKRKEYIVDPNAKALPSSELRSADTIAELKQNRKKLSKMTLASRLEEDVEDQDEISGGFGAREMTFVPRQAKMAETNLNKRRHEQNKHRRERKQMIRKTTSIKGKIRMNKPDISS